MMQHFRKKTDGKNYTNLKIAIDLTLKVGIICPDSFGNMKNFTMGIL